MDRLSVDRIEDRKKNYQKGVDILEMKKKREEGAIQLRKKKRNEHICKKRAMGVDRIVASNDMRDYQPNTFSFPAEMVPAVLEKRDQRLAAPDYSAFQRFTLLVHFIIAEEDEAVLTEAAKVLRKLLAGNSQPSLKTLVEIGISSKLIKLLSSKNENLLSEVSWCLINLSSGPADISSVMLNQNIAKTLAQVLEKCESVELANNFAWILGNISADSIDNRDTILETGVVKTLVGFINENFNGSSFVIWTLSNLSKGKPMPEEHIILDLLKIFPRAIETDNEDILVDACWILSNITDGEKYIDKVSDIGIIPKLIDLLAHPSQDVQGFASRVIGNIIVNSDKYTRTLLNLGILDNLGALLYHPRRSLKKEALLSLGNFLFGNDEQVELVISHPCMKNIVRFLLDADQNIRYEALWAIGNATHTSNRNIIKKLEKYEVLKSLVENLKDKHPKTLVVALKAIDCILEAGTQTSADTGINMLAYKFQELGGVDMLEFLQSHPNVTIYNIAVHIMMKYYGVEEDVDENLNGSESNGFVFS
ncbi:unnamed protein product [Blepharisma stoltei]|uniref:Importin subunit alpha n=1 Tax=Blepharisma stoltei TaxID=1481888 RepID=A0AAU9KER3_9CILI|nr:unnamed protein product [Blepharisma stoltei]